MASLDPVLADNCMKFVAIFGSGVMSGVALHTALVGQPAMLKMKTMEAGARAWYEQFEPTKNFMMKMSSVTVLAACGTFGLNKYRQTPVSPLWLVSGLVISAVLPYTIIVMSPTNNLLLQHDAIVKEKDDNWIREQISTWGSLHSVRVVANLFSFGMMCYAAIF